MSDYVQNDESYMKRIRYVEEQEQKADFISEMPPNILASILSNVTTKEAVQTCTLSKIWKDIWKIVPNIMATTNHFTRPEFMKQFVHNVLVNRDTKINLTNVDFEHNGFVRGSHVDMMINYAISHNGEKLKVHCYIDREIPNFLLFNGSSIPCNTLTHLDLSFKRSYCETLLPIKMEFPELIECRLRNVTIQPMERRNDNNEYYAEPFSGCKKMTTLLIKSCAILNDAKCLIVDGDNLTNVTIWYQINSSTTFRTNMRTPNLISFTYICSMVRGHSLEFEQDLNSLQNVRMEVRCNSNNYNDFGSSLCSWFRKFTNAHSFILSSATLMILSEVVASASETSDAIPHLNLSNLRTLTIKLDPRVEDHGVPRDAMSYLLQDTTSTVTIHRTAEFPSYYEDWVHLMRCYHVRVMRYDMNNNAVVPTGMNFIMWNGVLQYDDDDD